MGLMTGLAGALGSAIAGIAKVTLKVGFLAVEYGAEETIKYGGRKVGRRVISEVGANISDSEENRIRMEYAAELLDAALENIGTQGHQRVTAATIPMMKITDEWRAFETKRLTQRLRSGQERIDG